jgi:hypothetical protein
MYPARPTKISCNGNTSFAASSLRLHLASPTTVLLQLSQQQHQLQLNK